MWTSSAFKWHVSKLALLASLVVISCSLMHLRQQAVTVHTGVTYLIQPAIAVGSGWINKVKPSRTFKWFLTTVWAFKTLFNENDFKWNLQWSLCMSLAQLFATWYCIKKNNLLQSLKAYFNSWVSKFSVFVLSLSLNTYLICLSLCSWAPASPCLCSVSFMCFCLLCFTVCDHARARLQSQLSSVCFLLHFKGQGCLWVVTFS